MMKKCEKCGLNVDISKIKRCPRCNSLVDIPKKCEDCKGCSLYSSSKNNNCC